MGVPKDTHINNRSSPTTGEPGLFSRLLERAKSQKGRKRQVDKDAFISNNKPESPERTGKNRASAPGSITAPSKPSPPTPPLPTMGAPFAHHQQSAPTLKKRASIRDRFRLRARDNSSQHVQSEKQRVVYKPTHAATDFSRLALSPSPPSRQQLPPPSHEPRTVLQQAEPDPLQPNSAHETEDESQNLLASRHYLARGLQTLDENEPVQVTSAQHQIRNREPRIEAHQAGTSPMSSRQHGQVHATDVAVASTNHHASETEPGRVTGEDSNHQPTDYELFLKRAEERERAYREQLLRSLSQRKYPRPEPELVAYQTTYTADSAVVAEASGPPRKGWEGRRSGLDSGIGSKSSSQQGEGSRGHSDEPPARVSGTWERGHRKRTSWTPSFGPGGRDAERKMEQDSAALIEVDEGLRQGEAQYGGYTTSGNNNNMASFAQRSHVAQQPRTLRRQTSIKQKLGEYIRPAKPPSRYDEPELKRGKSKRVVGNLEA